MALMEGFRVQNYREVLAEMRKPVVGCFIAGTLVHTKDGLKPIEQIKVGDWVLSRPENPEGEPPSQRGRLPATYSVMHVMTEPQQFLVCQSESGSTQAKRQAAVKDFALTQDAA